MTHLSDFSVLSGADDDTDAASGGDVGAGEEKIDFVLIDSAEIVDKFCLFGNGDGFTGQKSLIDAHRGRVDLENTNIGRDFVANSNFDNVARDNARGANLLNLFSIRAKDFLNR